MSRLCDRMVCLANWWVGGRRARYAKDVDLTWCLAARALGGVHWASQF